MERNEIEKLFKQELDSFEGPSSGFRDFTVDVICKLPEYFTRPHQDGSENGVVSHTRASMAFANVLFTLDEYQKFLATDRDTIRAALMLHDGMIYGTGEDNRVKPEHPELMALYLENEYWNLVLPPFMRADIIAAVRNHSCREVPEGASSEIVRFVRMCVLLATRKESTVNLPGVEAYYLKKHGTPQTGFDSAISIVHQMTDGCSWDGEVYVEGESRYVYLDGCRVRVADELREAFLTVGQARAAGLKNSYVQTWEQIYSWEGFLSMYPDWDMTFYGTPGQLYIVSNGQCIPVSDQQACALGAKLPGEN